MKKDTKGQEFTVKPWLVYESVRLDEPMLGQWINDHKTKWHEFNINTIIRSAEEGVLIVLYSFNENNPTP